MKEDQLKTSHVIYLHIVLGIFLGLLGHLLFPFRQDFWKGFIFVLFVSFLKTTLSLSRKS